MHTVWYCTYVLGNSLLSPIIRFMKGTGSSTVPVLCIRTYFLFLKVLRENP
jgi:hypothetical protein